MAEPIPRGRFAPSPTGPLHFGSLIAAVGSFLDIRSRGGQWLLRIEDLDPPREQAGAADDIMRTLESYALTWDETVIYQSRRSESYDAAIERLHEQGQVYYCRCSRKDIEAAGLSGLEGYRYPGTCRTLGLPARGNSLRILVPDEIVAAEDRLQGTIQQNLARDIGDFILHRRDGLYSYQLAVVVDDADQGITDVCRGTDLIDSTPRQVYLQRYSATPGLITLTCRLPSIPRGKNSASKPMRNRSGPPTATYWRRRWPFSVTRCRRSWLAPPLPKSSNGVYNAGPCPEFHKAVSGRQYYESCSRKYYRRFQKRFPWVF